MKFERARTNQQIENRKKEIIKACSDLYDQYDIEGINLKAIGEITSFSRSTIYNYYECKEDILLDVFYQDILVWSKAINTIVEGYETLTVELYCKKLTNSLVQNKRLLKLMSLVYTTLEKACSLEKLITFKTHIKPLMAPHIKASDQFFPQASQEAKHIFFINSNAFILGLYPMTHPTEKQQAAMDAANYPYDLEMFETLCYSGLLTLAKDL